MKSKIVTILTSFLVIYTTVKQCRVAIENLHLTPEKLNEFIILHSQKTVMPFIYNLKGKFLSEEEAALFQEYSATLTPYMWVVLAMFLILIINTFSLVKHMRNNYLKGAERNDNQNRGSRFRIWKQPNV